ncbi:ATP-binding protein [Burkholderia perseverans]|uniref:ATP-binding protein n=1 Tax=Burkholderia perseverans TaxID=2615214 RepID=UPI001FED31FF|nr:ATP-binding protein [Burkholderia perseverans]
MKVGLTSKLFLAILVTCIAVALAMSAAMRYSFESGFGRYLVGRDDELVDRVTKALEHDYAEHGNWAFVTDRPDAWQTFMRSVAPIFPRAASGAEHGDEWDPAGWGGLAPDGRHGPRWPGDGFAAPDSGGGAGWPGAPEGAPRAASRNGERFGDPDGNRNGGTRGGASGDPSGGNNGKQNGSGNDGGQRGTPPHADTGDNARGAARQAPASTDNTPWPPGARPAWMDGEPREPHDAPWPPGAPAFASGAVPRGWHGGPPGFRHPPPIALYDAARHRIAGYPPPPDTPLHALRANGAVVGWLAVAKPGGFFYEADRRFQTQQLRATWLIAIAAVLLSALVAIVLARRILAPVRRIVHATHELADGHYAVRVPEHGGDELSRLAADFNRLAAALAAAERARRDFFADISHELRTPLAVLRGELEALEDGVRRPDAATFASLQAEIALLSKLIDDLHELSLADIGALSFEMIPVDIARVAEITAESFAERFGAKRIALDARIPREPVPISGDPHRLAQLLQNLLENALRYTDPGGQVRITVEADGEQTRIGVLDSHPGVPDAMLPRVFDRLFRVDVSRSRQSGGSGLGLALCKHIVEAHGGSIAARRSPLGGLWILMRFPTLKPDHEH